MKPSFERSEVERFRALIASRLGLFHDDTKLDELTRILQRRMEDSSCSRVSLYLDRFGSPAARDELYALAEQLTVGETYFFRNFDQFRAFAESVIPERMRAQAQQRRLRILSAGCSTGEEAYSLAILLRERWPELGSWDVRIIAIDVNGQSIERATQGRYSAWAFRGTSADLRAKYFSSNDERQFSLQPALKTAVCFEQRNLVDEDPLFWQAESFDVVFCRNVTMYFGAETTHTVIGRIAHSLTPGGFLFLGHAETLRGISHAFHLRHTHDTFYYRRKDSLPPQVPAHDAAAWVDPTPPSETWFDVIQRASERVAALTDRTAEAASAAPVAAPWDRAVALELLRQERLSEATELLRSLPAEARSDPDAQLLLAALLTNGGDLPEAERVCRQLIERDELNAGAHYLLALGREHAGDRSAAAEHDRAAAYLDPEFAMPRLHLGLLAKRGGDRDAARRELAHALTLLVREDASRVLLFGGGFTREALIEFCRAELRTCGGET